MSPKELGHRPTVESAVQPHANDLHHAGSLPIEQATSPDQASVVDATLLQAQGELEERPQEWQVRRLTKNTYAFATSQDSIQEVTFRRGVNIDASLFSLLFNHSGRVVPREMLLQKVRKMEGISTLGVYMSNLRSKLETAGVDPQIVTTEGERRQTQGYRLNARRVKDFRFEDKKSQADREAKALTTTVYPTRIAALTIALDNPEFAFEEVQHALGPSKKGRPLTWTQARRSLQFAAGSIYRNVVNSTASPEEIAVWDKIKASTGRESNRYALRAFCEQIGENFERFRGIPYTADIFSATYEAAEATEYSEDDPGQLIVGQATVVPVEEAMPEFNKTEVPTHYDDGDAVTPNIPPVNPPETAPEEQSISSTEKSQFEQSLESNAWALQQRFGNLIEDSLHWINAVNRVTGSRMITADEARSLLGIRKTFLPRGQYFGTLDLIVSLRSQEAVLDGHPFLREEAQTLRDFLKLRLEGMLSDASANDGNDAASSAVELTLRRRIDNGKASREQKKRARNESNTLSDRETLFDRMGDDELEGILREFDQEWKGRMQYALGIAQRTFPIVRITDSRRKDAKKWVKESDLQDELAKRGALPDLLTKLKEEGAIMPRQLQDRTESKLTLEDIVSVFYAVANAEEFSTLTNGTREIFWGAFRSASQRMIERTRIDRTQRHGMKKESQIR